MTGKKYKYVFEVEGFDRLRRKIRYQLTMTQDEVSAMAQRLMREEAIYAVHINEVTQNEGFIRRITYYNRTQTGWSMRKDFVGEDEI